MWKCGQIDRADFIPPECTGVPQDQDVEIDGREGKYDGQ